MSDSAFGGRTVVVDVLTPTGEPGWIEVGEGVIVAHGRGDARSVAASRMLSLAGASVEPRFTDLHCHGGMGFAFDDADLDGVRAALAYHCAHGAGQTLLSLVSAPVAQLADRLRRAAAWLPAVPEAIGIHLEGPFLAPGRRGAHDPTALTAPTPRAVDELLDASQGALRCVTIAPELPGALEAITRFADAGVVVAVGHTEADYDQAAEAFDRGASVLTHTFNAMPPLLHRRPGPVGAALDRSHVVLEAIADGHHLHDSAVRMLFAAAPGRIALVTDAMSATGCADGAYQLGSLAVEVRRGVPYLRGTDTLAGSTLTLDAAVRRVVDIGVPRAEAIDAVTTTPRRVLGVAPLRWSVGTRVSDLCVVELDSTVRSLEC